MLTIKKKAPAFTLEDKDTNKIRLSEINSDFTIVYFYPKDNTPGCTLEAQGFNILKKKFEKANATILGISGGDKQSKTKFCEKNNLNITLLSDPEFKVATKYGVYIQKKMMGKKYMGIKRTTFLLDKNKKIIKIYNKVKPSEHPQEVLMDILQLKK